MHRTARITLRPTSGQRRRLFGLLASAGDVWACVLEANWWRCCRHAPPLAGYQELCRELAGCGPGTFGELDSVGARSVLRRYSDAWFAAAKRRKIGDGSVRFPRRRRRLVPIRWYHGTFTLDSERGRVRLPTAAGAPPLWVRLGRAMPYPAEQVRAVTLLVDAGRLCVEITAEVPVAVYPPGQEPDPGRVAGIDLGIIHPYAAAGPDADGLLVSGRAIRAEHHLHLRDTKARRKASATRAPTCGQVGSRRWRKTRRRQRRVEARHRRRVDQARHEAAGTVISWAVQHRVGTLVVGDPRGVLDLDSGRQHNRRVRTWAPAKLIQLLSDKAAQAGIRVVLVDERGSSSTCPRCRRRVPKPAGRVLACRQCQFAGHRDLAAAATIATRLPGGGATTPRVPGVVTHRRAGRHLPGVVSARRDPRRRPPAGAAGSVGRPPARPTTPTSGGESLAARRGSTTNALRANVSGSGTRG